MKMSETGASAPWSVRVTASIGLLAVAGGLTFALTDKIRAGDLGPYAAPTIGTALAIFLSLLPAMICFAHNTTRRRQLARLRSLKPFAVSNTTYFRSAELLVNTDQTPTVNADFGAPLLIYFFLLLAGFAACFLPSAFQPGMTDANLLLSGLQAAASAQDAKYPAGTFTVIEIAFIASYVYALGRLLERVNNNDLYPISVYYYAVRTVMACAIAVVLRHSAAAFALDEPIVILLAFIVGFAPDLFILAMSRRAFQVLKVLGIRNDPSAAVLPTALPLLVIDDLSRDKIDRLNELGVDSAQVLARQNPFMLLTRLPYELPLVVDWIAQAQLYILVGDERLTALRKNYVRNIFDLGSHLGMDPPHPAVCSALDIDAKGAAALRTQITQDPSVMRLGEVRRAMVPPA